MKWCERLRGVPELRNEEGMFERVLFSMCVKLVPASVVFKKGNTRKCKFGSN